MLNKFIMNNNRAITIAKRFIPDNKKDLFHRAICKRCIHDTKLECLECCYCQDGSYYDAINEK